MALLRKLSLMSCNSDRSSISPDHNSNSSSNNHHQVIMSAAAIGLTGSGSGMTRRMISSEQAWSDSPPCSPSAAAAAGPPPPQPAATEAIAESAAAAAIVRSSRGSSSSSLSLDSVSDHQALTVPVTMSTTAGISNQMDQPSGSGSEATRRASSSNQAQQQQRSGGRNPKCANCQNHQVEVAVKGHKRICPRRNCRCKLCLLTNRRRKIMASQVKVRRAQDEDRKFNRRSDIASLLHLDDDEEEEGNEDEEAAAADPDDMDLDGERGSGSQAAATGTSAAGAGDESNDPPLFPNGSNGRSHSTDSRHRASHQFAPGNRNHRRNQRRPVHSPISPNSPSSSSQSSMMMHQHQHHEHGSRENSVPSSLSLTEIAEQMISVKSHVYLNQADSSPYFLSEFCDLLLFDAIVRADGDAGTVIHRLLAGKRHFAEL